jgi:hypothetical protein
VKRPCASVVSANWTAGDPARVRVTVIGVPATGEPVLSDRLPAIV